MLKQTAAAAAVIACSMFATASAAGDIEIKKTGLVIDGEVHDFTDTPFKQDGEVYVPLDEALPACGYTLGWDVSINAARCEKDGLPDSVIFGSGDTHLIGYGMYRYSHPVINVDGKYFISTDLFADASNSEVSIGDNILAWHIPDKYRIKELNVQKYGNEIVLNRSYIFEPVSVSSQSAAKYADIVNRIAEKIPDVNVYCMLMPDSGEIYAPEKYYCNQNAAIESVFDKLVNVTPVRTANILYNHASEDIYFRTDHHWTQRGAYYAWKAFMEVKGESVPGLEEFRVDISENFTGSFAKSLEGVSGGKALDNTYERLEKFLPLCNNEAWVYDDMYQKKFAASIPIVKTESYDYGCFLYGDCPLTVINGGVKNGRKIAVFKESMGNALATWAPNNYETTYIVDIRAFRDGSFDVAEFYDLYHFDDLLIESYPTTIESEDLRAGLASLIGKKN
ncbi:MAG: DHHW family protein [bacterium]|nr:DHHW family protein [bacterium]